MDAERVVESRGSFVGDKADGGAAFGDVVGDGVEGGEDLGDAGGAVDVFGVAIVAEVRAGMEDGIARLELDGHGASSG